MFGAAVLQSTILGSPYISIVGENGLHDAVTVSRASSATYISNGVMYTAAEDEPRFEDGGLLIEEQRTNEVHFSNDSLNYWAATALKYDTAVTEKSPVGNTVKLLKPSTNLEIQYVTISRISSSVDQSKTYSVGEDYTWTIYAKAGGYDYIVFERPSAIFTNWSAGETSFNLTTGAVGDPTHCSIEDYGDGWWKITITQSPTSSGTARVFPNIFFDNYGSFQGDGVSGAFFDGAQSEKGSFATSYIHTEGSAVTRAAEIPVTTNLAAIGFNQSEGTFVVEGETFDTSTSGYNFFWQVQNDDGSHRFNAFRSKSSGDLWCYGDASDGERIGINMNDTYAVNTTIKGALAYAQNNSRIAANGVLGELDTSCTIDGDYTKLYIGCTSGGEWLNGRIKRLRYYPERLTDEQTQELTS